MYRQITYSSPEEYAKLDFWEAKHAEYKPSAAYWHRRREATRLRRMPEPDETNREEVQDMIKELLSIQVDRIKRMSEEEILSVRSEMNQIFSIIHLSFDNLDSKYTYISLFRNFTLQKGIEVKQMLEQLQSHFRGRFRIYFSDAYDFVNTVWIKHQKFIQRVQPEPFLKLT